MVGDVGLCRWGCLAFVMDGFVKSGFERRRREAEKKEEWRRKKKREGERKICQGGKQSLKKLIFTL